MTKYTLKISGQAAEGPWDPEKDLDAEQREVVSAPACPVLVVAGAGTGKTRALTYRAAHLMREGAPGDRVLLCTFTNRAAREMLRRVEGLTGLAVNDMWAGTFHHVANRLLRRYGERVGLAQGYSIVDREDARDIISQCLAELGDKLGRKRYPQPSVLQAVFSHAVNTRMSVEQAVIQRWPRFARMAEEIGKLAGLYSRRKIRLNVLDFDDLLLGWYLLMADSGSASVANEIRDRFLHVLVDEYQDVNTLQAELTDLVAMEGHRSITVVGDDAQSIYSFRGADVDIMLNFARRYPGAVTLRLQTNYRSVPEILDLANRSIEFNRNRLPKTLRAERSGGDTPVSVLLATPEHQAAFVCQRILELHHEEAVPLRRMAVLYRAHSNSLELQLELNRRQIPYSVRSGLRFFEQAHIKDVMAYLRVMHNPLDELAAGRVIQMQSGLGRTAVAAVGASFSEREEAGREREEAGTERGATGRERGETGPAAPPRTLAEHLRSAPELKRLGGTLGKPLQQLASLLDALSDHLTKGGVRQAIHYLVKGPYAAYVQRRYPNAEERLEDLTQLAQYTDRYADVEEMLSDLALTAGVATESISPGEPPDEDRLALSTVHQAKGLEWRVVFVIWLCEGRFPSVLALKEPRGEEEERRLFHVAATRAEDQLYMVRPAVAESERDFHRVQRPSRFLSELLPDPPFETWDIEVEYEENPPSKPKKEKGKYDDIPF